MQIKVNLQIFIFIIVFFLSNQIEIYAYLMFFAFIHEIGHLVSGLILGLKPETLKIMPFGVCIIFKTSNMEELFWKKIIIAISGPFINILIAMLGIIFNMSNNLIFSNLLIAIFNLLPIYPLDGGRILKSIMKLYIKNNRCDEYIMKFSNGLMIVLTILVSIGILYLKNIGLLFTIIYLWVIIIRENRRFRLKSRIYNIIKNKV